MSTMPRLTVMNELVPRKYPANLKLYQANQWKNQSMGTLKKSKTVPIVRSIQLPGFLRSY